MLEHLVPFSMNMEMEVSSLFSSLLFPVFSTLLSVPCMLLVVIAIFYTDVFSRLPVFFFGGGGDGAGVTRLEIICPIILLRFISVLIASILTDKILWRALLIGIVLATCVLLMSLFLIFGIRVAAVMQGKENVSGLYPFLKKQK